MQKRQFYKHRAAFREAEQSAYIPGGADGAEQEQKDEATIKQIRGQLRSAENTFRKACSKARADHLGDYILKSEEMLKEGNVKGFWQALKNLSAT